MKAEFIVTIEGNWSENDKRVTVAMAERSLREAVKSEFGFIADRTAVRRVKIAAQGAETPKEPS